MPDHRKYRNLLSVHLSLCQSSYAFLLSLFFVSLELSLLSLRIMQHCAFICADYAYYPHQCNYNYGYIQYIQLLERVTLLKTTRSHARSVAHSYTMNMKYKTFFEQYRIYKFISPINDLRHLTHIVTFDQYRNTKAHLLSVSDLQT